MNDNTPSPLVTALVGEPSASPSPASEIAADNTSPTGFRNNKGQFASGQPKEPTQMADISPQLMQALMGSGSPDEMEQMRQYMEMQKRFPKFAPSQPRMTGGDLGAAVMGQPMSPEDEMLMRQRMQQMAPGMPVR